MKTILIQGDYVQKSYQYLLVCPALLNAVEFFTGSAGTVEHVKMSGAETLENIVPADFEIAAYKVFRLFKKLLIF